MLRSTISRSLAVALLVGMVGVTGCGTKDAAGNNNVRTNNVRTNNVQGTNGHLNVNSVNGRTGTHNITRLQMSQDLADRIAAMKDVRSANVLLAGNSAYVAITLDEAGSGTHNKSTTPLSLGTGRNTGGMLSGTTRSLTNRGGTTSAMDGTTYGMDGTMAGRSGTMTGIGGSMPGTGGGAMTGTAGGSGAYGNMGIGNMGAGGTNTGGLGTYGSGTGGTGTSGLGTGGMGTRGLGTGMGTGRTGSTGMGGMGMRGTGAGTTTDTLSKEVKDRVTAEIQRNAPQIRNVYVSSNPDFVQRVNGYADQARAGYPLQGFVNEFKTMVQRIFPTRGNANR